MRIIFCIACFMVVITSAAPLKAQSPAFVPSAPASGSPGLFSLTPSATPAPTPQLAPIAPPVPVPTYSTWMLVCGVTLILLLLAALLFAFWHYRKNRPQPPLPSPREVALAALEALHHRVSELEPYPFSIAVSDVLRRFVSEEFHVRATEQTSPEFLAAAASSPRFSEADKSLLAVFLEKADLIKFARVAASSADSETLLEQACRFVKGGAL